MEGSNGKKRIEGDRGGSKTGRTAENMISVSCCIPVIMGCRDHIVVSVWLSWGAGPA